MSSSKFDYVSANNSISFWWNRYINYQGIIGRPILSWPLMDFMSIFAEKKAHILVQNAKFVYSQNIRGDVKTFLDNLPLLNIFQDAIQQASMNGYAIIDIQRIVYNKEAKTYIYVNPFPSVYDQWNFDTFDNKVNIIAFQTCLNTQRFKTPNVAIFSKDKEKFNLMNFTGDQGGPFMIGAWGMDVQYNEPMKYYTNEKLQGKTIKYSDIYYFNDKTKKKEHVWPYVNENHAPFYVFRNRQFTLGYKNEAQNSDMWFLGSIGYLIPSALERAYQEQEVNITRIIGSLDPQLMPIQDMASTTDKTLKPDGKTFATTRSIQFTLGDDQQVSQQASTFNGSVEVQNLKDWFDLGFKLCVGFDLFGESATRESTATENLQRAVSERENLIVLTEWYKKQIKEAVCEALFYTFGQTFEDYFEIKIENQRGGLSPVEVQNILQIYQMGLMSKELAIRKLNPNMTEQELQEELANIDIDKQLQMQEQMESPSMASPQDTAGGVEQGNTLNE